MKAFGGQSRGGAEIQTRLYAPTQVLASISLTVKLEVNIEETTAQRPHMDLLRECMYVHAMSGSIVCKKCECTVSFARKRAIRDHLLKGHSVEQEEIQEATDFVIELSQTIPEEHELREIYLKGSAGDQVLEKIEGLPEIKCEQCSVATCRRYYKHPGGIVGHYKREHSLARSKWNRDGKLYPCQTVSCRKDLVAYFRIRGPLEEAPANDGPGVPSRSGPVQCADASVSFTARVGQFDFSRRLEDSMNERVVSRYAMSQFVSAAGCLDVLNHCNLTREEAGQLSQMPTEACSTELRACIEGLDSVFVCIFRRAQKTANDQNRYMFFRMMIGTPGLYKKDRPFRFLSTDRRGDTTVRRYANWAKLVVVVACRAILDPVSRLDRNVPEALQHAVTRYRDFCVQREPNGVDPDDEELHHLIVEIYVNVVYEIGDPVSGKANLFANVVYIALCTHGNRGTADVQFNDATRTGNILTGVMYAVSCCAVLYIYGRPEGEERSAAYKTVETLMNPCVPVGLTRLVELRAVCAALRELETPANMFIACMDKFHGICGFTKQKHASAKDIGKAVRMLHQKVDWGMFQELLRGKALPLSTDDLKKQLEGIVDDAENRSEAYCAYGCQENEAFVNRMLEWLQSQVAEDVEYFFSRKWVEKAIHVLLMIIGCIHLTGGGPGRGTEIATYLIRNKPTCRRTIFFMPDELMIIPTFNKVRFSRKGEGRLISRHPDPKTTFHFKIYTLLIRPILVENLLQTNPSLEDQVKIMDELILGQVKPEKMAAELSKIFAEGGLPFKFSEYRHHTRGLVKLCCIRDNNTFLMEGLDSVLPEGESSENGGDESDDEGAFESLTALQSTEVQQAGHSVQTMTRTYGQLYNPVGEVSIVGYLNRIERNRAASHRWQVEIGVRDAKDAFGMTRRKKNKRNLGDLSAENRVEVFEKVARRVMNEIRTERTVGGEYLPPTEGPFTPTIGFRSMPVPSAEEPMPIAEDEQVRDGERREVVVDAPECVGVEHTLYEEPVDVQQVIEDTTCTSRRPLDCFARENGFEGVQALRLAVGRQDAQWKSEEQRNAMETVATNDGDAMVIIGTGGGKTAVVVGPILYEYGYTIWISPLRSLKKETRVRLTQAKVNVFDIEGFNPNLTTLRGNVILVSPESIRKEEYSRVVNRLVEKKRLNRVVIDEAHLVFTDRTYRESMRTLSPASRGGTIASIVMLTATAPHSILRSIVEGCGSVMEGLEVFRADPYRGNLKLRVDVLPDGKDKTLEERFVFEVLDFVKKNGGEYRVIGFCLTRNDVASCYRTLSVRTRQDGLSSRVRVCLYHGKLSDHGREKQMEAWNKKGTGSVTVMVATNAFGCGIDAPDVRIVFLNGGCRNVVEFWQEGGRAGRDGNIATVKVLYHKDHLKKAEDESREVGALLGNFQHWAENKGTCRRLGVEKILGGAIGDRTCPDRSNAVYCDICEAKWSNIRTFVDYRQMRFGELFKKGGNKAGSSSDRFVACRAHEPPTKEERLRGKEQKLKKFKLKTGEMYWIRLVGKKLESYCIQCVLDISTDQKFEGYSSEEYSRIAESMKECGGKCVRRRAGCWRCYQAEGHFAVQCPYLRPIYKKRAEGQCGACWISSIGGEDVHMGVLGSRCAFKASVELCLRAWAGTKSRLVIEEQRSPYMEAVRDGTIQKLGTVGKSGAYIRWLLEDRAVERASIYDMTAYLVHRLGLEKIGIA